MFRKTTIMQCKRKGNASQIKKKEHKFCIKKCRVAVFLYFYKAMNSSMLLGNVSEIFRIQTKIFQIVNLSSFCDIFL